MIMGQVSSTLRRANNGYSHWCPGCEEMHYIATESPLQNGAYWTFNGSVDRPTFSPSVKISSGHFAAGHKSGECWCNYKERLGEEAPFECGVCHYFIRDGMIEFCSDSTHSLAGKTIPLPALPKQHQDNQI